jgi:glycerophosphoryl diester phosphodiesterase
VNHNRRQAVLLTLSGLALPSVVRADAPPPPIFAQFSSAPSATGLQAAIAAGADFLMAPVVVSSDGGLAVAPGVELSAFTDVAERPEFAGRRKQRTMGGAEVQDWFVDDFTLAELTSLATGQTKRDRRPSLPPTLLALGDVVDIARRASVSTGRVVGIAPLLVRPTHFAGGDLALEPRLADFIRRQGYDSPAAAMIVHSTEPASLRSLMGLTRVRRVQVIGAGGGPEDSAAPRFRSMANPQGLALVRGWADAIAPAESLVIQPAEKGAILSTGLARSAKAADLKVFASPDDQIGASLRQRIEALFLAGADGVETTSVAQASRARSDAIDRLRRRAGLD